MDKSLHPGSDNPIKQHYKGYFDTVFIAYLPFFKVNNRSFFPEGHQKSKQITFEEAKHANEIFKGMSKPNADIYSYDNDTYPSEEELYLNAERVSWKEIKQGCGFRSYGDIKKALQTSIGAYRKVFQKPDLAESLTAFTDANQIYHPTEGHFEVLSKTEVYKAFHLFNKTKLIIEEEFSRERKQLDIVLLSEREFVDEIDSKDYFIYDTDKELLFAIDWDDFFFLICSSRQVVDKVVNSLNFEGFYCDDTTETSWELTKEEIDVGHRQEKYESQMKEATKPIDKKQWWRLW